MENVVYFLGAGFSAPLGLPVMSNFLEKAKDIYYLEKKQSAVFEKSFDLLNRLHKIKSDLNADLSNIEEVLSILTMTDQIDGSNESAIFTSFLIDVIAHYESQILFGKNGFNKRTFNSFIAPESNLINSYANFVLSLFNVRLRKAVPDDSNSHFFVEPSPNRRKTQYTIITLNYDTIIETVCDLINDVTNKDQFELKLNTPSLINLYSTVSLLKLHGCASSNNIMPPSWYKIINSDDVDIYNAWKLAYFEIGRAQHIRFIGYSLPETDAYIKYLFKSSILQADHLKKIDVICKDYDGSVKNRFEQFVPKSKLRFYNGKFEDILHHFNKNENYFNSVIYDSTSFEKSYQEFFEIEFK